VTGLAGDAGQVGVDARILVRHALVAVLAADAMIVIDLNRVVYTADLVFGGTVAVDAKHIVLAHVDIGVGGRMLE
jgi:hypothetical protein